MPFGICVPWHYCGILVALVRQSCPFPSSHKNVRIPTDAHLDATPPRTSSGDASAGAISPIEECVVGDQDLCLLEPQVLYYDDRDGWSRRILGKAQELSGISGNSR
ncbi:hypothetical protein L226DRAFT_3536 [Lentinus tigrinus ALCF2SS1-7]|uniref:uncharacterized protein n=1 Tax=Lentinus tigrinus ALCF2SS1-7 TaxID=1328758 RepID=UPI0011661945|nr:hypothetical protein L226DRAFT_3536 [Lentinus tigrinus ALCF2SS1-7]